MLVLCKRCKRPVAPRSRCANCGFVPPVSEAAEVLRVAGGILFVIGAAIATRRHTNDGSEMPGAICAAIGAAMFLLGQALRP